MTSDAAPEWLRLDDEKIVWSGGPELWGYAGSILVGVLLLPVFGAGLPILLGVYLTVSRMEYVISTQSVYKRTGVLSRTVTEIGLDKIQDTSYGQSLTGRKFGFGTVEISTAGSSGVELSLDYVGEPQEIQSILDERARALSDDDADGTAPGRVDPETIAAVVDELRQTREALERIERRLR